MRYFIGRSFWLVAFALLIGAFAQAQTDNTGGTEGDAGSRAVLLKGQPVHPDWRCFGGAGVPQDSEFIVFQRDAHGADHTILPNDN